MDGSGNIPSPVIGKSEKPKCFKHVKFLLYTHSYKRSSWIPRVPNMSGEEKCAKYQKYCHSLARLNFYFLSAFPDVPRGKSRPALGHT
jgi:hypothetical protein